MTRKLQCATLNVSWIDTVERLKIIPAFGGISVIQSGKKPIN